eukprot:Phypoly_transcript_07942.p1 GENE.Phypoly_transcript_07942~~Phypoly_transcript_07942.p1  ORF type:complete len:486 (+),score=83.15 Phypoly_transcript_07942:96-1460(+)
MEPQCVQTVFSGRVIHSISLAHPIEVYENAFVGVSGEGKVLFLEKHENDATLKNLQTKYNFSDAQLIHLGTKILIPGFIDTHTHAPQYVFTGTGTDLPLMEWLDKYTFNYERKCSDDKFSLATFTKAVQRHIKNGSTTCVYFSALYLNATQVLLDVVETHGQRALIGKVCMDQLSPDDYVKTAEENVQETEEFVKQVKEKNNPLITPVITPRFVPTCSGPLLQKLGELVDKYQVPVQSHVSENKDEVAIVEQQHPGCSYTQVYDKFNLLNSRTIMAHGVHLTDDEFSLFKQKESAISHCPVSNFSLCSGIFPLRKALDLGIKVGLGTDVAGGYSPSLLETMRQAIAASNIIHLQHPETKSLSWQEAFYLATVGGSQVIGMQDKLGNFQPGKWFDALVIDPTAPDSPLDVFEADTLQEIFQKFIFLGDDRNIAQAYVQGKKVVPWGTKRRREDNE